MPRSDDLNAKAYRGLATLAVAMGALIFLPAGTLRYWQGWLYLAVFFAASFLITLYLIRNDPALLRHRLRGGPTAEKEPVQKIVMWLASLGFIALLVVPGFDHRFKWSNVPLAVVIAGDVLTLLCFYTWYIVLRENPFASATIEIAGNQQVVSTGPYAIVRHPMYASGSLLFISTSLALGSYWSMLALPITLPALIWRLLHEEKFLARNLSGYREYCAKVRWRMIPGIF
jgi:protein-S-isoprenylcysteine O-methyltransferase Ste14